jgi:hypothetical protein
MTTPVLPITLTGGEAQDAKKFGLEYEDPAIKADTEGGYVYSRARFTRAPRRTWSSGYTYIADVSRLQLEAFWTTVMGGSVIFQWRNPADGSDYLVRFAEPIKLSYVGAGTNKRWDVSFKVEEA